MTVLYIVRHGETTYNLERRIQGQLDIDLSDLGIRQAKACGEYYKDIKLDVAISSDLCRAKKTAETIIAGKGIKLKTTKELRERSFGSYEGSLFSCLEGVDMESESYDGESDAVFHERVMGIMNKIANEEKDKRVLVLTHGQVIKTFLEEICPDDPRVKKVVANCSTTIVEYTNDHFVLKDYSLTDHLSDINR